MRKATRYLSTLALIAAMACEPAMAAGGLGSSVKDLMDIVLTILQSVGLIVVSAGLCWGGYKIIFKGANIMDVAGPVLGSVVVGASPWVAEQIV